MIDELKLQNEAGTAPENWLLFNLRVERLVRSPSCDAIVPLKLLSLRFIDVIAPRPPMDGERVPDRLFELNSTCTTLFVPPTVVHVTPYHALDPVLHGLYGADPTHQFVRELLPAVSPA